MNEAEIIRFGRLASELYDEPLWREYYETVLAELTDELVHADPENLERCQQKIHFVLGFKRFLEELINRGKWQEVTDESQH